MQGRVHDPDLVGRDARVGVEKKDVVLREAALGERAQGDIDARAEAEVAPRVDVVRTAPLRHLARLGGRRIVDDGHGIAAAELLERPVEESRVAVGDGDDLGRATAPGVTRRHDLAVQREELLRDPLPRELARAAQPGLAQCLPPRRLQGLVECLSQGVGVAGRHQDAGVRDDVGNRPAAAGHDGHARRHRLDGDAAELLQPPRPRDRRHGDHVRTAVAVGELLPLREPEEPDAVGDAELGDERLEVRALRTVPGQLDTPVRTGGRGAQERVHALVRLQAPHVGDDGLRGRGGRLTGCEPGRVDAQGYVPRGPVKPLPAQDLAGLAVADVRAGRSAQRGTLEPPEGHGIALVDVLRGVQQVGRLRPPQEPEQQDLSSRQRDGLLV